jgi:translation elongation factor EF-1beta
MWIRGTLIPWELFYMGHVVVKYKVTINQPEEGRPDYEGIASVISLMEEVQACEIKPLAFGMMFIEVQAVLGEGEGIVDGFEDSVRKINDNVGQIEALEMGRL